MQEVKPPLCSLLLDEDTPPVLLGHFLVCVSFTLKIISTYGMMAKNFVMAMETINCASESYHVGVPQNKCVGQRLRKLQDQSVRQWLEKLCMPFLVMIARRLFRGMAIWMKQVERQLVFLLMA
jgi:hypothetical protein